MKKNITIKDIASVLSISKSTVSRALADKDDIRPETKKAVLEMAAKMHYKPNLYAKNLTKQRSKTIGVVVPEFTNSFFPKIIIQIQQYFEEKGFNVLITQSNESAEIEQKNLTLLENNMVEGIILSQARCEVNKKLYQTIIESGTPIVFINRTPKLINADSVTINDYKMSFLAVEKLILNKKKRNKIMHLRGPKSVNLSELRCKGYRDVLEKYKIDIDESLIIEFNEFSITEGYNALVKCIDSNIIPDAIFAFNDLLAIGAMRALQDRGYRIPEDVAIMGFSESDSALICNPQLSSVEQPHNLMGLTAAKTLLNRIDNPNAPIETIVLHAKINLRGSTNEKEV